MNVRTRFAWRKQDSDAAVEIVVNICHIFAIKLKKVGHIRQTCLSVFRRTVVKKSIEGVCIIHWLSFSGSNCDL